MTPHAGQRPGHPWPRWLARRGTAGAIAARVTLPGMRGRVRRLLSSGLTAALGLWLASVASAATPQSPPRASTPPAERSAKDYQPNLTLVARDGRSVRFYDDVLKDRIVLLNTMFTSCAGICPPITTNLLAVQKPSPHTWASRC